jgi:hypothetical protein
VQFITGSGIWIVRPDGVFFLTPVALRANLPQVTAAGGSRITTPFSRDLERDRPGLVIRHPYIGSVGAAGLMEYHSVYSDRVRTAIDEKHG